MMEYKETILFNEELCTACSCCTIACSFHRKTVFGIEEAAIRIVRDLAEGTIKCSILDNCDLCKELETPECIAFCWPRALCLGRKPI